MTNQKLGFIGIGNMASAIMSGILSAFFTPPQNLYMYNPHPEKMQHFVDLGCTACKSVSEIVENCSVIFLCIKPQVFPEVLETLEPLVANKKESDVLFVSVAAGITFKNLRDALGAARKFVRAMPNTPLLLGEGATALSRTEAVSDADFRLVREIFECCGLVKEIPQEQMNAVIPVSGSSPAYIYQLAKLTCAFAEAEGMEPRTALELFCKTLTGSAQMLLQSGKDPQALIDMVTSKGGTTLALLDVLKERQFDKTVLDAFAACKARAEELSI